MSAETYFTNFNKISYANNVAIDITQRTVFYKQLLSNPYIFTPVQVEEGSRADQVAYNGYKDPYMSWIVYLSNETLDPYFEWYYTQKEFTNYIKDKYNSIERSQLKVKHYINDYIEKDSIEPAAYEALSYLQKGYWEPTYGYRNQIVNYVRKKEDFTYNTNFIIAVESAAAANTKFNHDEIVEFHITPTSYGRAQYITSNNTHYILQHIYGDVFQHDDVIYNFGTSYITGKDTGANVFISSTTFLSNNIPAEVLDYYSPVYAYDYELEKLESYKNIRALDPQFVPKFLIQFKDLMSV